MMRTAALLVALLAAAPAVAQPAAWLHLEVTEQGRRPARVRMTLPVSAVVRALPHIPRVRLDRCSLSVGHHRVHPEDLRRVVEALRQVEPGTTIRHQSLNGSIEATASNGLVHISIDERFDGDRVEATLPQDVVTALTSAGPRRLEIAAAVQALARRGGGDLALVSSDDARIRLWVDHTPGAVEE